MQKEATEDQIKNKRDLNASQHKVKTTFKSDAKINSFDLYLHATQIQFVQDVWETDKPYKSAKRQHVMH